MTTQKINHNDIRFVVTADWHAGLVRYSRDEEGIPGRHTELLKGIEFIINYTIDIGARFLIVAGDIFHTNQPSQLFYADLIPLFKKASDSNLPVFILSGNHDAINTISEMNALRSLFKSSIPRLHVINKVSCNSSILPGYNLVFLPHINRCEYSVFNDGSEKKFIANKIKDLNLNEDNHNILIGHAMLEGSIQGAERLIMRGGEQTFKASLPNKTIACFFGHMHTPQEGKYKGVPYYYPGSIQAIDFGERKDIKSFIDVTLSDNKVNTGRIAVPTRKCLQEEFNFDSYINTIRDTNKHAKKVKDCIVKVVLDIASEERKSINEQRIHEYYKDAYWVEVSYKVTTEVATRNKDVDSETDPDKAFSEWYKAKKYPDDDFTEVMAMHKTIMTRVTSLEE